MKISNKPILLRQIQIKEKQKNVKNLKQIIMLMKYLMMKIIVNEVNPNVMINNKKFQMIIKMKNQ